MMNIQNKKTNVCHITSVHSRYDVRIFLKECLSLASQYKVFLIVADGKGNEEKNNISILDVGRPKNRLDRILFIRNKIFKKTKSLHADIYHLHDPELLSLASKLKKNGKKVIFDAHEDFSKQLLSKTYLFPILAKILSFLASFYEKYIFKKIDAIVFATEAIQRKFSKINSRSICVSNYPILAELYSERSDDFYKKKIVCYIGGLTLIRGVQEIVDAAILCSKGKNEKNIIMAGKFQEKNFFNSIKQRSGYKYVDFLGEITRENIRKLLSRSLAGIVTFLPYPNHIESQPNKMFEYMSAGIPVIASNFPLWREIIEGNNCGICVNPDSPQEIASAINYLFSNINIAKEMGENGRRSVEKKYNWESESLKLLNLYKEILA